MVKFSVVFLAVALLSGCVTLVPAKTPVAIVGIAACGEVLGATVVFADGSLHRNRDLTPAQRKAAEAIDDKHVAVLELPCGAPPAAPSI